ncbi:hypothetical protein BDB00DRAFT_805325 [Zychaea mexicana]|uniref:uncharacterized protein n=1 Tax=Zychaea mexicana TaxID=64656 RepID=UPI0022FE033C|nr:uncharacterized protein BDB00DRAFT_805325 [Zychaea mexicana]KAI9497183.1 hypothetical protein BDB00DRAFT_805325 [Zychaea mexicana]
MPDSLEAAAIEELVLHGSKGCPFGTLWSSLKKKKNASPKTLLKAFFKNDSVELYENDQCVDKCDHSNDKLHVIASADLRRKILMRELKNRKAVVSDDAFRVLEHIASMRHDGITQIQLSKDMGLTSATIYTRVKRLENLGLIVRHSASHEKTYTQMCYHIRFTPSDDDQTSIISSNGMILHEMVDRKIVKVLANAEDHMIPLTDVFNALGMTTEKHIAWMRNHIVKRVEQGVFEKVKVVASNKRVVYLKWIAPLSSIAKPQKTSAENRDQERPDASLHGEELSNVILERVEKNPGATTKDLYELIPNAKWTNLRKSLHFAVQKHTKYRLYTVIESQGRTRHYRYYTRDGIKQYYNNRGESAELSDEGRDNNDKHSNSNTSSTGKKRKRGDGNGSIDTQRQTDNNEMGNSSSNNIKRQRHEEESSDLLTNLLNTNDQPITKNKDSQIQPMKGSNITANKRKQAMSMIVLRDKVREIDHSLRDEIAAAAGEAKDAPPIARPTMIRLAEGLHNSKTIRLVRSAVPVYGGGMENKVLLLHPDLNQNDALVKQYLDHARTNKAIHPHPAKRRAISEIQIPSNSNDSPSVTTVSSEQHVSRNIIHLAPEKHWREVAQRHGWIQSKWLRAKLLHEYLFNQHKDLIRLGDLLNELPLKVYCQMIGLYRHSDKVEAFMRTTQKDMPLANLPRDIETEMITSRYRLRLQLSGLVDVLEALELLERVNTGIVPSSDTTVRLLNIGKIRDFSVEQWPVIQTFELGTSKDIHDFWKELQFVCTSSDTAKNIKTGHILDTILVPHTWSSMTMLTQEQRNTLDQHLGCSQEMAPVDDVPLIAHLSRTLGLPQKRIKNYYDGYMRAHNKQKTVNVKSPKRMMVSDLIRSGRTFDPAPATYMSTRTEERTFAPTRKFIRSRTPRTEKLPDSTTKQPPQRWPEVEHDALIHTFAIMRHRAETNKTTFSWMPITQVMKNREPDVCRRRISHLKETWPRFHDHIEILKRKWAEIYAHGIATGELVDGRPWDWLNFDLLGQLKYFIVKLQETENGSSTPLPSNTELLKTKYQVITSRLPISKIRPAVLDSHLCDSLKDKDGLSNTELLATVVLRMVFMMPQDTYDAEKARALFRPFSEKTVERALQYLRAAGALIIMRKNYNRLIPGQVYNVSEKFIRMFTSERFPRSMLDQANDFYNNKLRDDKELPSRMTSGSMVVLLDMISNEELALHMTSVARYSKTHKSVYYPRIKHDALANALIEQSLAFATTISRKDDTRHFITTPSNGNVTIPKSEEIKKIISNLSVQARCVYQTLEEFGAAGATLVMLQKHVQDMNSQDIIKNVEQLKSDNLVHQVGFEDDKFVTAGHAPIWFVEPAPHRYLKPRMWYFVDGSVNQDVFQGCVRKLVLLITEKPGISLAQIQSSFNGYLTVAELEDLLQHLSEKMVIKSESYVQYKRPKGFDGLFKTSSVLKKIGMLSCFPG